MPDLRFPAATVSKRTGAVTFREPIQPGSMPGTVYFGVEDSYFIINNL